jgi:hypothetical protein
LDDAAAALGEVQRRVSQRTFSGYPMRVSSLLPGEASSWLPACFAEFVSPHTNAQRLRELCSRIVVLPKVLHDLCSLVGVPLPDRQLTFAQLEHAASAASGCTTVGKYCVHFLPCGKPESNFGVPRGGPLSDAERLLFISPVAEGLLPQRNTADVSQHPHYVEYSECLSLDLEALIQLPSAGGANACMLRSLISQVDACCPSVVAKAAVAERKAALAGKLNSAADLVSFSACQLQALATRCCLSTNDMHADLLHQATVSFNRSAGRKKKVGLPRVDMSREQLNKDCTADALRTWLMQHTHMTAAGARGLRKSALVDAVLAHLVSAEEQA